ncbi:metallophosphoesterase [Streptomyces sp. NPDC048337]|uniref:metallophosphoesterase family protein n=1 Tax=Streptomyces sp. NPDC048337 TaxID=3365535 RepID=UPI00372115EA
MTRVAAVGDVHLGPDGAGLLRPAFDTLGDRADLLLLADGLTRHGTREEARVVAAEVAGLPVPVVAVLGNHDYQSDQERAVTEELRAAGCGLRIALTHFAPVPDTLAGEPLEIYPFLGSHLLAEAMDEEGADLAAHGHAHLGTEHGMTAGGIRVRNVAMPVIDRAFAVYDLSPNGNGSARRRIG